MCTRNGWMLEMYGSEQQRGFKDLVTQEGHVKHWFAGTNNLPLLFFFKAYALNIKETDPLMLKVHKHKAAF